MVFSSNIRMLAPIMRSLVANSQRACLRPATVTVQQSGITHLASLSKPIIRYEYQVQPARSIGSDSRVFSRASNQQGDEKQVSLAEVLEREIQEELNDLNQRLSSDQFPGFSVETDHADVKLTKQVGDSTVVVRFTVSSSLAEWKSLPEDQDQQQQQDPEQDMGYSLLSMPEFQVQITRNGKTLELSCYFEEMDLDDESGQSFPMEPTFTIDEMVMYDGEPRETEFAVSADYFQGDLQEGLTQFLSDHGIDDEFAKNLINFATSYEKKQYIGLMKRMKEFVSK